jgi:hypothetical protein
MRASAIERLSHGEIKLDEWAILTPAEKTKKRRRNYIEGLPENLWLWLERTPASAFKLTPRQITKRREKAFIPDITIVIGYYDTARGFWPWSSTYETINWIAIGSGLRPIVISPVTNNILITIIGMFFGNQITKR